MTVDTNPVTTSSGDLPWVSDLKLLQDELTRLAEWVLVDMGTKLPFEIKSIPELNTVSGQQQLKLIHLYGPEATREIERLMKIIADLEFTVRHSGWLP